MNDKAKIHAFYILLILFTIIVIQFSNNYATVPGFTEKFNFALTIASLLLAILAIVYAYISDNSVATSMSKLESASANISAAAVDVKSATQELSGKIDVIPPRLEKIEKSFAENFATFRTAVGAVNSEPLNAEEREIANEIVELAIKKASALGRIALYLGYRSYVAGSYLTTSNLLKDQVIADYDYYLGYLIALRSVGLIETETIDLDHLIIRKINPAIVQLFSGKSRQELVEALMAVTTAASPEEVKAFREVYSSMLPKIEEVVEALKTNSK